MNLGEIKRFVNDGLEPLNKLIGSFSDDETINSVFGLQKKILTGLDTIKTKTDTLPTIASNVSSILSKVNNLGSQKIYGISWVNSNPPYQKAISLTGAGLIIIINPATVSISITLGSYMLEIAAGATVSIPLRYSNTITCNSSSYKPILIWCPLS